MSKMACIVGCFVGALLLASTAWGWQGASNQTADPCASTISANDSKYTNLELILEGPMAVCMLPDQNLPGKVVIYIPNLKNHFLPGLDWEEQETPLCAKDFHLELGGHQPGPLPKLENDRFNKFPEASCPQPSNKYLSLVVDVPDQVVGLSHTEIVVGDGDTLSQQEGYRNPKLVSRTLFYYCHVSTDPTQTYVDVGYSGPRGQKEVAACHLDVADHRLRKKKKVPVRFPFPLTTDPDTGEPDPSFIKLNDFIDNRIVLSTMPKKDDDASFHDATQAYQAVADMMGLTSSAYPPPPKTTGRHPIFTTHNDCRAPQIFLVPQTKKKAR